MSYTYELIVYTNDWKKIKRFVGNDLNELTERFEMWAIKSNYPREDMKIYKGHIQHAGY